MITKLAVVGDNNDKDLLFSLTLIEEIGNVYREVSKPKFEKLTRKKKEIFELELSE